MCYLYNTVEPANLSGSVSSGNPVMEDIEAKAMGRGRRGGGGQKILPSNCDQRQDKSQKSR